MIIIYASNTGHTKQYAELLEKELNLSAYSVDKLPSYRKGEDAIFLGWIMAGKVMGYEKAKRLCNVRCVVATGMSPESPEQSEFLHKNNGLAPLVPLFYLQAGYDYAKLKGIYKLLMSIKGKEILGRYEGKSQEEKESDATYRMVTQGYSVVSLEHLAPVLAWANKS